MTVRFSASAVARLMQCPASANLDAAIPGWTPPVVDPTAGQKGVGTQLHAAMEPILRLSQQHMNWAIDALTYVNQVRQTRRFQVLVEHTETASWLHDPSTTTADMVLFVSDELHIIDFKFGKIPVEAIDNKQLLFYAATYSYLAPKAKSVNLHIVQPPCKNYDCWQVTSTELYRFMQQARASEQLVLAKDTTFQPGDACLFCPANPHSRGDKGSPLCPAMMKMLYPDVVNEDEILAL